MGRWIQSLLPFDGDFLLPPGVSAVGLSPLPNSPRTTGKATLHKNSLFVQASRWSVHKFLCCSLGLAAAAVARLLLLAYGENS